VDWASACSVECGRAEIQSLVGSELERAAGFEPTTLGLGSRCSTAGSRNTAIALECTNRHDPPSTASNGCRLAVGAYYAESDWQ